jgi:uncharacterized membrane protein YfcA
VQLSLDALRRRHDPLAPSHQALLLTLRQWSTHTWLDVFTAVPFALGQSVGFTAQPMLSDTTTALPPSVEWWHIPVIFVAGLIGESYGSIVGGGSVVTIAAQTFLGVPLQSAIATDDAAALGIEAGVLTETHQKVADTKHLILRMVIPISLGGVIGTLFLLTVPVIVIKGVMTAAVAYLLFHSFYLRPRIKRHHLDKWRWPVLFGCLFLIGLYNNFIGVGEGAFSKMALMTILGLTFMESHGLKAIAMVPTRFFSLVVTAVAHLIVWPYLLTLWCATFLAGKYSTKAVKRVPERYLGPALTAVSLVFIAYLLLAY